MEIPFFSKIKSSNRILIAGAGGGFDFFSGLPLYFLLKELGKEVFWANLSFTRLEETNAPKIQEHCWEISAQSQGNDYFPEAHLCRWFEERGESVKIYAFDGGVGVAPLKKVYQSLFESLKLDTVILVDGGTDSLMCGNETGLGSPTEDMTSISAAYSLNNPQTYLVCLGFGVDFFHGVCHAQCFEAIAELSQQGGYLGAYSLHPSMTGVTEYLSAIEYVNKAQPQQSIVCNSIASAIEGHYGDYHKISRTKGSQLWINPLMSIYWCFELAPLAKRILFLDHIKETQSWGETLITIQEFRKSISPKKWENIPF